MGRAIVAELGSDAATTADAPRRCQTHAEWLRANDETVVDISGTSWMAYRGALVTAASMPVYGEVDAADAARAMRETGTFMLRYNTRCQGDSGSWWHVVCRDYQLGNVSRNTRSKVRRGSKRLEVRPVEPGWLAREGYACHVACYSRYENAQPMSRETFERFMRGIEAHGLFEPWGCFRGDALVGYVLCQRDPDGVFLHTIDLAPEGLRDYSAYATIHTLLEHYVGVEGIPVSNGNRSIAHATEMQGFLLKFGFVEEPSDVHVHYRAPVGALVALLYPFRALLWRLDRLPGFHQLGVVLRQEEIARGEEPTR
jgi:hypothetical protein